MSHYFPMRRSKHNDNTFGKQWLYRCCDKSMFLKMLREQLRNSQKWFGHLEKKKMIVLLFTIMVVNVVYSVKNALISFLSTQKGLNVP